MSRDERADRPWLALYDDGVPSAFTPRFRNAVELFEHGASAYPDRPAMYYFDAAISFAEAAAEAHALARALVEELGVRRGDRVAIMLQNVPQLVNAVHAIWLAGAVVTPVNIMNKSRELDHQLNDAGVRVIICLESSFATVASVRERTPLEHVITTSELDGLTTVPAALVAHGRIACPGALPWADVVARHRGTVVEPADPGPDDPAMLTYTSGTTGLPKAAVNTHGGVVHNAEVWERWYRLGPDDVTVAMAPLFHITGMIGHLCAARQAASPLLLAFRFEAGELLRLIERWRGTYVVGPLTAYVALLEHPDFATRDIASLTKVGSGGAPVSPAVVDRYERATGVYLHNAYGMTETTSPTHLVPLDARAPVDPGSGALAVGVPVPGVDCRIVSVEDGVTELAHGEVGELLIKGPMVVSGYWNRPEETAAAIQDGWLHTGDVGLRDADGWFWIVDRIKDMINVSGYKVWPRDVEDVLYQHPDVREAAVVGAADSYRGETVHAYVTVRESSRVQPQEIVAHCRATLAVYKAPREVFIVDELPKTATGKILRRALRGRSGARPGKPWLALYGDVPASVRPPYENAVELARSALRPDRRGPLMWYFDTPIGAAEIDRDADALACALAAEGVGPGDRVLLQLQNMPQFVVALLATWRLGAIAVPVNAMYRERELATLLGDCRPAAVIVLDELVEPMLAAMRSSAVTGPVLATSAFDYLRQPAPACLAGLPSQALGHTPGLRAAIAAFRGQRPDPVPLDGDDVAALVYTSGTTGPPKGAMILHRNLVFSSTVFSAWMELTPDDVVMGLAPPFHVSGLVANIGVAWSSGAPLILAHRFDAAESLRLMQRHRATFTTAAITAFSALMGDPGFVDADLSALAKPCTGGAPVAPAIVERWRAATGHYIRNTYGMTETTAPTHLTPLHLEAPIDAESGALSIGVPVCDTMVEIVGPDGQPMPPGVSGELVTTGPQVVPGYWRKPQESAHAMPGGRLHTGDIGVMNADGWFFLLDRSKDMIVASGYKVWPREVEDVLCEHPAVREAAVVGVPDEYRGETVKAFVSLRPGHQVAPDALVAFCRQRMAAYKYPRQVELRDELPKTASGKILRRELRGRS